jgi:hypothetical protein
LEENGDRTSGDLIEDTWEFFSDEAKKRCQEAQQRRGGAPLGKKSS